MQWAKRFGMLSVAAAVFLFAANQQVQASLVAYWSFDQQSGNDFLDASGNNNTAVNNGNVTTVSGVVGNAASFPGHGILTVADSTSLDTAAAATASRSVAFWFKTTTTSNLVVLEKGTNQHFVVQTEGGSLAGKISFRVNTTSTPRVISLNPVNDNNWHHFAATFDAAANLMNLYIDGVLQATNTQASPGANDEPFVIGARVGPSFGFVGSLDELAVWNRPLAPPEIAALVQGVSPLNLFSTVALHPTYQYTGAIQPATSPSSRDDPHRTKLTDGVFGSSSIDDGKWVACRDPLGYGNDNGEPQPQIDFSFGLKGLRITDVQVQYLRAAGPAIYEPDSMVVEFYQDPAFTQLVGTYTITGFSGVDGVYWKTYSFPSPVYAEYARVKFYNDQEWTWLGEVMFFGNVPEPSTWAMLILGAVSLGAARLCSRRKKS